MTKQLKISFVAAALIAAFVSCSTYAEEPVLDRNPSGPAISFPQFPQFPVADCPIGQHPVSDIRRGRRCVDNTPTLLEGDVEFVKGTTVDFADLTARVGSIRGFVYVRVQGELLLMPVYNLPGSGRVYRIIVEE